MLNDTELPPKFWAEAYVYWAYCRNRTSVSFLNADSTPFQQLHGFKPDISHLRIFGSPAFIRIPPSQRKKLDVKALKGIFVGVFDDAAYRIFVPDINNILKSCDVIFDEKRTFRTRKVDHIQDPASVSLSPSIEDLNVNPPIVPPSPIIPTSPALIYKNNKAHSTTS